MLYHSSERHFVLSVTRDGVGERGGGEEAINRHDTRRFDLETRSRLPSTIDSV